jgi:protein-tyrosine phosphatase
MDKTKILFVCLGNICRSPSAEAVMNGLLKDENETANFTIDSAGTSGFHAGEPADARMQTHALKRGIKLTSISRQVDADHDFDFFDYIIGMDEQNMLDLKRLANTDKHKSKLHKMTDFCQNHNYASVPDPYYGGDSGFELVLDLLEDACQGLLTHIKTHG